MRHFRKLVISSSSVGAYNLTRPPISSSIHRLSTTAISGIISTLPLHHDRGFLLGLVHHNLVRHWQCAAHLAFWIMSKHDLHLDSENTLPHKHVPHCLTYVVLLGLTRG